MRQQANVEDAEWHAAYNKRQAVERLFGKLKSHRRLDSITVRGLHKVRVHTYMAMIATLAHALAVTDNPRTVVEN